MQSIAGVSEPERKKKSWSGFWSGFIWFIVGFVCIAVSQISAIAVLGVMEVAQSGTELSEERMQEIALDGDALAFAFVFLLPMIVALLAFVVKIRRKKPFFDYLGIRPIEKKVLITWLLYAVGFFIVVVVCDKIFGRPPIPEWMSTAYASADHPWLFFISVAVLGPLTEELLYRGYIIRVWAESITGPVVGTVLLSLLWATIHLQYDLYDMAWIFFMGVILCMSRLRTNSIIPALAIHVAWNTISLVVLVLSLAA